VLQSPAYAKPQNVICKRKKPFVSKFRTNDIYEFRVDNKGKFYRLFSFWDSRDGKQTLVVCTHGLVKKSNKTPKSEIDKAEDIMDKYFKGLI